MAGDEGNHIMTYKPFYVSPGAWGSSHVVLFDTIRDISALNSKGHEYTTRDGHVKGVLCDITFRAGREVTATLVGVSNTWKMRNAFRKFHFLRDAMFRKAGVTKSERGAYGHTIRPYMDLKHAENGVLNYNTTESDPWDVNMTMSEVAGGPQDLTYDKITGGTWNRSEFVAAEATAATGSDVDTWTVHICDEHNSVSSPWTSVGMINAYNQDRMSEVTPNPSSTIDGPENPLALLSSQSVTGGEVAAVAEDDELLAPPYDITDAGDSIRKVILGFVKLLPFQNDSANVIASKTVRNVFLPAGFLLVNFGETPATLNAALLEMQIDVKAVWECRELA